MYDHQIKPGGSIEERALAIGRRSVNKGFLDGQPKDCGPSVTDLIRREELAVEVDKAYEDAHRENEHRGFLIGKPTVIDIRDYLDEGPHRVFDGREEPGKFFERERQNIVELFKELLGLEEPFCKHAKTWLENCLWCSYTVALNRRGYDSSFLDQWFIGEPAFLSDEEVKKELKNAGILLDVLGWGIHRAEGGRGMGTKTTKLLSTGGRRGLLMEQFDGYQQDEESIGGKFVRPEGFGRDEDEKGEKERGSLATGEGTGTVKNKLEFKNCDPRDGDEGDEE